MTPDETVRTLTALMRDEGAWGKKSEGARWDGIAECAVWGSDVAEEARLLPSGEWSYIAPHLSLVGADIDSLMVDVFGWEPGDASRVLGAAGMDI